MEAVRIEYMYSVRCVYGEYRSAVTTGPDSAGIVFVERYNNLCPRNFEGLPAFSVKAAQTGIRSKPDTALAVFQHGIHVV